MKKTILYAGVFTGLGFALLYTSQAQNIPAGRPQNITLPDSVQSDSLLRVQRKTELDKQLKLAEKAIADHQRAMKGVTGTKRDDMAFKQAELEMQRADIEMALADIAMEEADREMQLAMKEMAAAEIEMQKAEAEAEKSEALFKDLMKDLQAALGTDITSFGLSRNKLVVNGKEQPAELHKKLADKYLHTIIDITYHYDLKTGRIYTVNE